MPNGEASENSVKLIMEHFMELMGKEEYFEAWAEATDCLQYPLNDIQKGACYFTIGFCLSELGQIDSALISLAEAVAIYEGVNDKNLLGSAFEELARAQLSLGMNYAARKNIALAIKNFEECKQNTRAVEAGKFQKAVFEAF